MTDSLFELVPVYGGWIIFAATFLSCLAMPIPSSFIMLAGGAFLASGDLSMVDVALGAWIGAVIGDQVGYWLGRTGGAALLKKAERSRGRAKVLRKARELIHKKGGIAVFLSRWLLSPLGPYVNLIAGAGEMRWPVFALWGALGEVVWVTIYVSLGYVFAGEITQVADIASNAIGLITAAAVTWILGRSVFRNASRHRAEAKARRETA